MTGYSSAIKIVIWTFMYAVEVIYLPIQCIRFFKKRRKCPPVQDEILYLTASELAQRIRKKQITSTRVIQAYIDRVNEVNPFINAVIEDRFEAALQDAKNVDDLIQTTKLNEEQIKNLHPLLGVPITIKGSLGVEGMNHSSGRVDCRIRAKTDAVVVKTVRDAGAIPLLISNVPEMCLNYETSNKLIGTTANPHDVRRTPGGSSGGEASLLGSGASLIGLGSDIGGSLRLPAHCCGIWSHKPSPYAVSGVGHYPDCKNKAKWKKVFSVGPMARYASDLKYLLNVIIEPDAKLMLKLDEPVNVKQIKVYYMDDPRSNYADPFDQTVLDAVDKVVAYFDSVCGSKCTKVKIPLMKYCAELSFLQLLCIGGVDSIYDGTKSVYQEVLKYHIGISHHQLTSVWFEVIEDNIKYLNRFTNRVDKGIEKLRNTFLEMLGDDGVFIMPSSPNEANFQGDTLRKIFNGGYLSIFNSLGFPVTNCPVMFSPNGLPIGVQVVGAPNMDRLTLHVAEEIENLGGWKFH